MVAAPTGAEQKAKNMSSEPDPDRFPFGSPSWEYCKAKGLNKSSDVYREHDASIHDLLTAVLISADCMFDELRRIRVAIENRR